MGDSGDCLAAPHKHPIVVNVGFDKNSILIKGLKGSLDLGFRKAQLPSEPNVGDFIAGPGPANRVPDEQALGREVAIWNAVMILEGLDGHQGGIFGGTKSWISEQRYWFLQTWTIHDRYEGTKW